MIVAIVRYLAEIEKIDQYLVEHRQFLERLYQEKLLIASGPQNPRVGGVIIANMQSRDAFLEIFAEDPFSQHNLVEYHVYEFTPVKYSQEIASLINLL